MARDAALRRRRFLASGLAAAGALALPAAGQRAENARDIRVLVGEITGGATPRPGGIEVELPQLAESGNSVALRVRVASPMTEADHVRTIHVLAERNPRPRVATWHLTPSSGRAEVAARIRLAGTQVVTVLAELSDRSFRIAQARVQVTQAACVDESL